MTLKEILKERGMSQSDLARKMEVSFQTVSLWCRGRIRPTDQHFEKLATILNVSIASLIFEQNEARERNLARA